MNAKGKFMLPAGCGRDARNDRPEAVPPMSLEDMRC
jgi:hypothetical protein